MIPVYYFIDPALLATKNITAYLTENSIWKLTSFYINFKEIEDILLVDGDIKKIFNFPIKKDIVEDCLNEAPSCDQMLSNAFWNTFLIIYNKYLKYCNKDYIEDPSNIYNNPNISEKIKIKFDKFLTGCIRGRNNLCECENILNIIPIYTSEYTHIKDLQYIIPFTNPNKVKNHFPLMNVYPSKIDDIESKVRKFQFILDLNCIKEDSHPSERELDPINRNYNFLPQFWESELLYDNDKVIKKKIIEVMTKLIMNPDRNINRMHRLKNEYIIIDGRRKNLDQIDIFQTYNHKGVTFYPRLRFRIFNGIIYFNDIIDSH